MNEERLIELRQARRANLQALRKAYQREEEVLPAYPVSMMIEPTNACDLACPLCPTGNGSLKRAKGVMSFERFKKVIDDLAHSLLGVTMWNYGEPYLNKNIHAMVDYCRSLGIKTTVSTNGFPFQKAGAEHAAKILDHPPDNLIVSIDGATAKSHAAYRIGSDFDQLIAGLKQLIEERTRRNATLPRILAQFIAMRHNEHEILDFIALAKGIGVDVVTLKSVNLSMDQSPQSETEAAASLDRRRSRGGRLPRNPTLTRYRSDLSLKNVPARGCARPWESIVVNQDGEVAACCYDIEASMQLGNAFETDIKEIWNSRKYVELRRNLKKGRHLTPMCSVCTDRAPSILWHSGLPMLKASRTNPFGS